MMEAWIHDDYYLAAGDNNSCDDVLESGGGSATGGPSSSSTATASAMRASADMRAHSTIKAFVHQLTVPLSSPSPPPPSLPSTSVPEEPVSNTTTSSSSSNSSNSDSIHSCRCSYKDEGEDEDEFEDVDLETGDACSTTNATCIKTYLETRIHEGRAEHPCPMRGDAGCNFVFGDDHLHKIVDPAILAKHQHRATLLAEPSLRECPSCHTLVKGGSKHRPSLTCPSCGLKFCFLHATAHAMDEVRRWEGRRGEGRHSCRQYKRQMRAVERASASTVKRISKPCPQCKAPIEKDGGCNHISCISCRYEWCWLCDQRYTPFHYSPTNIFGCPGSQFVDFGGGAHGCCCGFIAPLCRVFRVLLALILLPGPMLLGMVVALLGSALWLPVGVIWASLSKLCAGSPAAVSCLGGHWQMCDLIFPLVLWMPFVLFVFVVRASRRRRLQISFMLAPMLLAMQFLDLDGE
ncbi:ring-finger-containing e3 partial [Nannochloropsis oceanica]